MKYCSPSYYFNFTCLADRCSDTCCRCWQIEIDDNTYLKYKRLISDNSSIGSSIKKNITGLTTKRFKNIKGGSCPFLQSNLLCELYKELGHENLPYTCKMYPRYINNFGGYEERGLSFSCPAAAKLISLGNFEVTEYEDDLPITEYTVVNAELFVKVKKVRDAVLEILRDKSVSVADAVNSILCYVKTVERSIRSDEELTFSIKHIQSFVDLDEYKKYLNLTIDEHLKHKHLDKKWKEHLIACRNKDICFDEDKFRIWLNYFIQRYFINSVYDLKMLSKVKAAILSFVIISALDFEIIKSMQKYSKETEHNKYNLDRLFNFADRIKI